MSECKDLRCIYVILSREGKTFDNDSRKYVNLDYIDKDKDSFIHKFIPENMIEENGKQIYNNINTILSV
jgi:hypothetical protein